MNQYFVSREIMRIEKIKAHELVEGIVISDERKDKDLQWSHIIINHSTFSKVSFKESSLKNCDFSLCVFIDCYFKLTRIENVKFVGCKFINCTFDNIKMVESDIRFTTFDNCYIDFNEIQGCLPSQSNIKWKLCTNLALESLRAGDSLNYRKFFFAEKQACEEHYLSIFFHKDHYYKIKYDTIDRCIGMVKYLTSRASKIIWGYGERIQNLILVIFVFLLLFAVIYYVQGSVFKEVNTIQPSLVKLDFLESVYHSFCNFLTINSYYTTSNHFVRIISVIESTLGVVLLGFFIAALFRFINRR